MNWPRSKGLQAGQVSRPVLWRVEGVASKVPAAPVDRLLEVMGAKRLGTWGHGGAQRGAPTRGPATPSLEPHWIGVRGGLGLHTDPRYARYSFQLVVRNDGWNVQGLEFDHGEPFRPGDLYCLDTHSPHCLVKDDRIGAGPWFVALVVDARSILQLDEAWRQLQGMAGLESV